MKTIAIFNNKGGVGKTTTTKMLTNYLASKGQKVLILDMDPQANISSQFLDTEELKISMYNVIVDECELDSIIRETKTENVWIAKSNLKLQEANDKLQIDSFINPTIRLKQKIERVKNAFDYILIDCPPSIDKLSANSLAAANEVIVPLSGDVYSITGLENVLNCINKIKMNFNDTLKISALFLNGYKNTKLEKEIYKELKEIPYFNSNFIGHYAILKNDTHQGVVKSKELERHKVSAQYKALFDSILNIKEKEVQ